MPWARESWISLAQAVTLLHDGQLLLDLLSLFALRDVTDYGQHVKTPIYLESGG